MEQIIFSLNPSTSTEITLLTQILYPCTEFRAPVAARHPLGPIIRHYGGIGTVSDNLQLFGISARFCRILAEFATVAHFFLRRAFFCFRLGGYCRAAEPETQIIFQISVPELAICKSTRKHLQNDITWAIKGARKPVHR